MTRVLIVGAMLLVSLGAEARHEWKSVTSRHFRVLHLDGYRPRAKQIARQSEEILKHRAKYFSASPQSLDFKQRADIYLYPTQEILITMTGGDLKAGSTSTRPSQLYEGKILSRRINITADDPQLLGATLPHELTHLVLNEILGANAPRWANEGLATLAESAAARERYEVAIQQAQARNSFFSLQALMNMSDYPPDRQKLLFYAQSMALVRFFVNLRNPHQFVLFLQIADLYDYERALWTVYEIDGYRSLEQRWRSTIR